MRWRGNKEFFPEDASKLIYTLNKTSNENVFNLYNSMKFCQELPPFFMLTLPWRAIKLFSFYLYSITFLLFQIVQFEFKIIIKNLNDPCKKGSC